MRPSKLTAIPSVTEGNLTDVARAVKAILDVREGRVGDGLDANVTFRDLIDVGAVVLRRGWSGQTGGAGAIMPAWVDPDGYDPTKDMTLPPPPTGFAATGAFAVVILQWDMPAYRNHAYTEIWRHDTNAIGNAVLIGTSTTRFFNDNLGAQQARYYWVRFVSQAGVKGAYNATNGTLGQTAIDPQLVLDSLQSQITESNLFKDLSDRIDLIDGPSTLEGSVAARVGAEATARTNADDAIAQSVTNLASSVSGDVGTLTAAIEAEALARSTADEASAKSVTTLQATVHKYSLGLPLDQWNIYDQELVDISDGAVAGKALRLYGRSGQYPNQNTFIPIVPGKKYRVKFWARPSSDASGLLYFSLRQFVDANTTGPVNGGRSPYKPSAMTRAAHVNAYGAGWGLYDFVWGPDDWQAGVRFVQPEFLDNYPNATGYWDIQDLTIVDATDTESLSASLQTEANARATADGSLFGQYTVKLDLNGYVAGFGLASESTAANGTTSSFAIRADRFYVAQPTTAGAQPTVAPAIPFVVQTTETTINGVTVPAGVYMSDAFIANGTITNAKIGSAAVDDAKIASLNATKINAGYLSADRIEAGSLDAKIANIDTAVITSGILNTARIGDGTITNAKIGNSIYSSTFNGSIDDQTGITDAGTTGWAISKSGYCVFNNVKVRGDVQATSLNAATGTFSGTLSGADGTFSGQLNAATGTFSGQLLAGVLDVTSLVGQSAAYNTPGTYTITCPAGFNKMRVTLVGGGGGGGGGTASYNEGRASGGGGGGGGSVVAEYSVTAGTSYTLVVGAGGAGAAGTVGISGNRNRRDAPSGENGGSTYIVGIVTAGGGGGGGGAYAYTGNGVGGYGGSGTANGQAGATATTASAYSGTSFYAGKGGNSGYNFGSGGAGGVSAGQTGANGTPYGGGGGGGSYGNNQGGCGGGGNGQNGRAIIEFYNGNGVVIRSEWTNLINQLATQLGFIYS